MENVYISGTIAIAAVVVSNRWIPRGVLIKWPLSFIIML